jgi:hypothetical protein
MQDSSDFEIHHSRLAQPWSEQDFRNLLCGRDLGIWGPDRIGTDNGKVNHIGIGVFRWVA